MPLSESLGGIALLGKVKSLYSGKIPQVQAFHILVV